MCSNTCGIQKIGVSCIDRLVGFIDVAYATDTNTHLSLTGIVFCLASGAITYKSKLQASVATSFTEAKFITTVHAAKIAKYFCTILHEFGIPQEGLTPLYEDNISAIAMTNEHKQTPNLRHIDIQHFAIQEWQCHGIIVMCHIPGIVNIANHAIKALGWTLLAHHACCAMGHFGLPC